MSSTPAAAAGVARASGADDLDTAAAGAFATDLDAYRIALRRYLTARVGPQPGTRPATDEPELAAWVGQTYPTTEERVADHARLMAVLHRDGWNRFGWPESAGGLGGDERHRAVLYDELSAVGLPVPQPHLLLETLGPPVIRFAPELAAAYLPAYLRGEEWWGQGFSEPEAGSDLASLRTRARRDGDNYVVSGSKLWTSHGATATRLVCLVRTGTPESRHRGLSMIMIDADSPGLTRRPIAIASGENELAEVFFDDVVVPADRLVGAEGQGWAVAMYLLQWERAMYAWLSSAIALRHLRELRHHLVTATAGPGPRPLPADAAARFGEVYADIVALRSRSAVTVGRLAAGETVGPEASVDKVLLATAEIRLNDLVRDLLGPDFLFDRDRDSTQWRADWWYSRSATILGGSAEVQRTILADHVLGLPKEKKA